jgi:hypothetical protein
MGKLTRKYKKNNGTKSMKKHKVSKKNRKSRKQLKKGGMKKTFTPSENSAFRPISHDDIESGKTGISKNTPKPTVSSFSLDEFDLESGTPIKPYISQIERPISAPIISSLTRNTSTPVFKKVEQKIFIPGKEEKKISTENLSKIEEDSDEEILYEKKQYNDYLKNYSSDPNIPPPLKYDDYLKEILIPEEGIKYVKYGIQLYTLPNTGRVYDKKGNLFTEYDIKMLEKKYKETPFIDPDDLTIDKLGILGIYKNKNKPPGSKNTYDKEGYLLNKAGLDALLHNYALQMKKGIRERTSKK